MVATGGLSSVFRPVTATRSTAQLPGGLPPIETGTAPSPTEGQPSMFSAAPDITAKSPTSLGGALISGFTSDPAANPPTALQSGIANSALGLAGILTGVPTFAMSAPAFALGLLSQGARLAGLKGGDTGPNMGMSQADVNAALGIALGSGANVAPAIAQGTGISPGQLADMNAKAPFGQPSTLRGGGGDPDNPDAPNGPPGFGGDPEGGLGDAPGGVASGEGTTGGGEGAAPGSGEGGAGPDDRGGLIGRKPHPLADTQGHVFAKALPSEFIVNPKATQDHLDQLQRINRDQPGGMRGVFRRRA